MAVDPRDEIWNATFDTYYDTYYAELVEEALLAKWLTLDHVTRIAVALTASGSTLAGLALWKDPNFSWMWPALAGTSAVLAIISETLAAKHRLRDSSIAMRAFASLRIELDTFRYRMKIDPQFPVAAFQKEFVGYRKRYMDECSRAKDDILRTRALQIKCQDELDQRLTQEKL